MQDTINDERSSAVVPHTGGASQFAAPPAEPPRRSRLPWIVAAVAVIAAVAVVMANRDGGPRDAASYITEAARTADLEDVVEGTATLAFADGAETVVRTSVPGVVTDVAVAPGDTLAPLQPVLTIDGTELFVLTGEAPVYRPLSDGDEGPDVETLEAALAAAGHEPGDVDEVFDADTADALRDWQQEVGLDDTGAFDPTIVLWAPSGAEVLAVDVALGDRLTGAEPLLLTGVPGELVAEAGLDQVDVLGVAVGDRAVLDVDGFDEPVEGRVGRIADTPTGTEATFLVTVLVDDLPAEARAGMSGGVEIVTDVIADAVVVPTGVIGGTAAQPTVPVLVDGAPVDRAVELGLVTATQTQVVAGVEPGTAIVLGVEDGA